MRDRKARHPLSCSCQWQEKGEGDENVQHERDRGIRGIYCSELQGVGSQLKESEQQQSQLFTDLKMIVNGEERPRYSYAAKSRYENRRSQNSGRTKVAAHKLTQTRKVTRTYVFCMLAPRTRALSTDFRCIRACASGVKWVWHTIQNGVVHY